MSDELETQLKVLRAENTALHEQLSQTLPGSSTDSNQAFVNRVAVKLPPFWPDKPAIWFAQAEAQFEISGIVFDSTKYNYIIAQLDQRIAGEIEDIITNPPKVDKYATIKRELIRRLSVTDEQKLRLLLADEELGDRKPSQLLRHLRSLAGSVINGETILRYLWLRRLPRSMQAILATRSDLDLNSIAEVADKINDK